MQVKIREAVSKDRAAIFHFLVFQKRADEIFSTLHNLIRNREIQKGKEHLDSLLNLIVSRCQRGITDHDAILDQNYGFAEGDAIHVDVGRLARSTDIHLPAQTALHVKKMLWKLREWLKEYSPELSSYLEAKMEATLSSSS